MQVGPLARPVRRQHVCNAVHDAGGNTGARRKVLFDALDAEQTTDLPRSSRVAAWAARGRLATPIGTTWPIVHRPGDAANLDEAIDAHADTRIPERARPAHLARPAPSAPIPARAPQQPWEAFARLVRCQCGGRGNPHDPPVSGKWIRAS